jgi:hypothetical protein
MELGWSSRRFDMTGLRDDALVFRAAEAQTLRNDSQLQLVETQMMQCVRNVELMARSRGTQTHLMMKALMKLLVVQSN